DGLTTLKRPVENVSWNDAVKFCERLSQKTGKTYRLPSEAQWEYACRAGTTTPFYFGESITPDLVNYNGNFPYGFAPKGLYRQQTTDVGTFPPNAFGLYDMHGNVWEWCLDDYKDSYNNASTDGSAVTVSSGNTKLLRGGSWFSLARGCRSAIRNRYSRGGRNGYLGFRVV
ncbi:MAG: formylglycine-generating enzyme family protein, partial [Sphaerospermopsis kisseleviana]